MTPQLIWWLGFSLTVIVSYLNQGIIAIDDYAEIISRIIPAQNCSFSKAMEEAGFRSPFPAVTLLSMSKLALALGLESPISQIRFVAIFLGTSIYSIVTFCVSRFFSTDHEKKISSFLLAFYFVLPLLYGRPLIENLSGAWLVLGAFCIFKYCRTLWSPWIFLSVLSISVASLFRFQTGICILALPLLLFKMKQRRAWEVFFVSVFLSFFLTGAIDWMLTGGFQRSLIAYSSYNLSHSSSYGKTPFYTFFLLFLGLSFPPAFLGLYKGFSWKKNYGSLWPVVLFFLVFVIAHSLVPHKEERFMIPVLYFFIVLLTPLANYWVYERGNKWRPIYFCVLNFMLLPLASFSVPQNNVISLVRYLDNHREIKTVYNYQDSVVLFPKAFTTRTDLELKPYEASCGSVVAVRESLYQDVFSKQKVIARFSPGPLEELLVKLNPRQNARRGTILLLEDKTCD